MTHRTPKHFVRNPYEIAFLFREAFGMRTRPRVAFFVSKRVCFPRHRDFVDVWAEKSLSARASWSDPGFVERWYPKKMRGERAARLVRAAFRVGRGKLDVLFRAGTANGRALVRSDAG